MNSLRTDPAKVKAWQDRSRRRLVTRSPLKCRKPMSKKAKKPEKGSVKDLEQTLDVLTREVLRQDERVCFTDGKPGSAADLLQLSHLFGRAQRPTRFDVHIDGNNHMMHESCNNRHNEDKSIYRNEFIRRFGKDTYEKLDVRAHSNRQFDYVDLHKMVEQRESMLK